MKIYQTVFLYSLYTLFILTILAILGVSSLAPIYLKQLRKFLSEKV